MFELELPGSRWSTFSLEDRALYESYFARSMESFSYENNWGFVAQETRVGAIRYEDEGLLITAVVKASDSPFMFILPPCGNTSDFGRRIVDIASELARGSAKRIVLRKLSEELSTQALETGAFKVLHSSAFEHPRDVPEDQFPQVVLDVSRTLAMKGSKYRRIRNDLRSFEREFRPEFVDLDQANLEEVKQFVYDWSDNHNQKLHPNSTDPVNLEVDPTAYTILADRFSSLKNCDYFPKIVQINGRVTAFTLAGRTSKNSAAQYVNLSLVRERGCSEFLVVELLRELSQAGIEYVNLGGAETEGQFKFKSKFSTHLTKRSLELEFSS
jgi:hypothetical protein